MAAKVPGERIAIESEKDLKKLIDERFNRPPAVEPQARPGAPASTDKLLIGRGTLGA